jgi:hypothetical protein
MYGKEVVEHVDKSRYIQKYLNMKRGKGSCTSSTYKPRLRSFACFVYKKFAKVEFDPFIDDIKIGKHDPYELLTDYSNYLQYEIEEEYRVKGDTVNERISTNHALLQVSCQS